MAHGPTVLIDGHNCFIRSYVTVPAMDRDGGRVGGIVGMIKSVRKMITDFRAANVLIVWDGEGGSQRRRSIMSEYKAGRTVRLNREYDFGESAEQELANMRWQRQVASEYLTLLGVPQVRADGVEADDLMAYVASSMHHEGGCIVVTTDQDLLQLVRPTGHSEEDHTNGCTERCTGESAVRIYSPIKKVMYDRERFISDYGVLPENFRLMKALTGDGSDNIKGIKGFGRKTIVKLFPGLAEDRWTSADLFAAAEALPKSVVRDRLLAEKARFEENLTLVDLSSPMLSATAARQAREALGRDLGCKEVDLRVRLMREGISFSDDRLVQPFRELVLRRRRMLAARPQETAADETIDQDNLEVKTGEDGE